MAELSPVTTELRVLLDRYFERPPTVSQVSSTHLLLQSAGHGGLRLTAYAWQPPGDPIESVCRRAVSVNGS